MEVENAYEEDLKKRGNNIADGIPEDPFLGSINTNTLVKEDKGQQLRSSARVFKKMKLEQEQEKKNEDPVESSLISPNSDQSMVIIGTSSAEQENKGHPIRCSTRIVRKIKQEVTLTESKKKEESKVDMRKEARKWSYEDKILFFDAVNEYGKDFENIQQYINGKLKKRGVSDDQMRSKDNVRQFFIRTFHEVSKHVKFSDGVKKVVQELYGVINYGELCKKIETITEKACFKLNELIYRGETCIRAKGKNIRIKTPMCRALVKLNQLDAKYEEIKLPNRVTVELKPKDMTSYLKVQSMAQNPRLKTILPIQKRVNALIECLNKRWKNVDVIRYEKSLVSNNTITNNCVPAKDIVDQRLQFFSLPLRLSPPEEANIELPSINLSDYLTRQTICLAAYESRLGLDTFNEIKKMTNKKKPKLDMKSKIDMCENKTEALKMEENEAIHYLETEGDPLLADAVHDAVNTVLSLQSSDRQPFDISESRELVTKKEILKTDNQQENEPSNISKEDLERIELIRKGWTEENSESLTIGEIYLMYGSDGKLTLEYSWDTYGNDEKHKPKKTAANFLEMWNDSYEESWELRQKNLTFPLSKLLSLAKMDNRQNMLNCACGHVCNEKPLKTPVESTQQLGATTLIDDNIDLSTIQQEDSVLIVHPELRNEHFPSKKSKRIMYRSLMHILPKGPAIQTLNTQQQLNSILRLKPKFCNRKGRRPRQKPIVVERKLPLLPNNLSDHQIVRMSIVSQEPDVPSDESKTESTDATPPVDENRELNPQTATTVSEVDDPVVPALPLLQNNSSGHQIVRMSISQESDVPSDESKIECTDAASPNKTDPFVEHRELNPQTATTVSEVDNPVVPAVYSSPSTILKEGDSEWINADVDYSLSSLLGHLESPVKTTVPMGTINSNIAADLSSEVDAQLQSLMTETSMDFAASFADLAASVVSDKKF